MSKVAGKKKEDEGFDVLEVRKGQVPICILGQTALICNRLSEKAKHELLLPHGKKNAAERAALLKHEPYDEFSSSPYKLPDGSNTYIGVLSSSFKKSMMTAALDLPSTKKAQIGRLTWVESHYAEVYGVPQIFLAAVRLADMKGTPDIRSRAVLPRWACKLNVTFIQPLMKGQAVVRLLSAAGMFIGIGDWRNEKGSGTFGSFKLVEPDDPEFLEVVRTGGRDVQIEAMRAPVAYDEETADLLSWFDNERLKKQMKGVS